MEDDNEAYELHLAEEAKRLESQCGVELVLGKVDPYATACELPKNHFVKRHCGPSPFGEGFVLWDGGGSCAGDPLPVRDITFID
jgi:hypothetical protein